MSFFKYIKAVATGPKSNRDLEYDEMFEATDMILNEKCESEQSAAFLLCLRVKLESDDELKACWDLLNTYIKRVEIKESVELGFTYDGKHKQTYLFPLYAKVLKDFFNKNKEIEAFDLVLSGDFKQNLETGVNVKDFIQDCKVEDNVHYFDRKDFLSKLSDLSNLRQKLYMRTIFNTVEKLLNPANSKYAITSAFHKPYVKKYNNLFKENYENLLILKGNEGNPEVFSDFKYWREENGEILEEKICLKDFDINYTEEFENLNTKEMLEQINNPSEDLLKLAKINAAVLLFTAKRFVSIKDAYEALKEI